MATNDASGAPTPPGEPSLFDRLTGIFGSAGERLSGNIPKPDQEEEDGMVRMSFLDHLEELRHRLIMIVYGVAAAFCLALFFRNEMWDLVERPARVALVHLHVVPPELIMISPMDYFQITWMQLPLLAAIFISSPWVLYQVWAFIAPGLYKHERKWAVPFVSSSAGLFILGGVFAYFVIFRYGLEFLLGIGIGHGVRPTVSMTEYYDVFVDVMLAVGMVFEIPILLFLLTLIHIVNPRFLLRHSRYAILIIVILAAIITPTGDVFNLTLFATPMIVLYFVGIFASYMVLLKREEKKFPWGIFLMWSVIVIAVLAAISFLVAHYLGYRFVMHAPFLVR